MDMQTMLMDKLRQMNKKGLTLSDMPDTIITLVIVVLIAAAGAVALTSFKSSQVANSYAANITDQGLLTISNTTTQFATLGTIIGVVLIIGVILAVFAFKNR